VVLSVDPDLLRAYRVEDDAKVKERILMVSLLREGKSTYDAAASLGLYGLNLIKYLCR
jgi:hypothetical protein